MKEDHVRLAAREGIELLPLSMRNVLKAAQVTEHVDEEGGRLVLVLVIRARRASTHGRKVKLHTRDEREARFN